MPAQNIDDMNARAKAVEGLASALGEAKTKYGMAAFCKRHDGLQPDAISHWYATNRSRRVPGWPNIRLLAAALVQDRFLTKSAYAQVCGEPYEKADA